MERFCDKCGTLVSGNGKFCPTCGAPMESAVDLGKPSTPSTEPMQSTPAPSSTYQTGQSNNYAQMPSYPQSYNANSSTNSNTVTDLSVGQWLLTFLIFAIPIAGFIMLFVWGFGNENTPRKNFCRAYLIMYAIIFGLYILLIIGSVVCFGGLLSGFDDMFEYYGALFTRKKRIGSLRCQTLRRLLYYKEPGFQRATPRWGDVTQ